MRGNRSLGNICGGGCFLALFLRSRAIYNDDTTSYVKVDEIYNDTTGAFDANNVNALLKFITGDADANNFNVMNTLDNMATISTTSPEIRTNVARITTERKDVIIGFGGLDWQVVYLSKDTDGNNILTLWLSSSQQDAFAGRTADEGAYYGFVNNSLYSDWSADWYSYDTDSYPSNMYGTSYIRAVTLNNGGQYALGIDELSQIDENDPYNGQNENSVFARFTMEEVEGSLTQYITTPSKMSWQLDQSAVDEGVSDILLFPNDSINVPTSGSYNSGCNYHSKTNYDEWASDYIWLPSITETGYDSSRTGIWEISTEQHQNISSSKDQITPGVGSSNSNYGTYVRNYSWLRSGDLFDAYQAYRLFPDGGSYSTYDSYVEYSLAVRPALHLNLTKVLESAGSATRVALNNNGGVGLSEIYIDEDGGVFLDSELENGVSMLPIVPVKTGFEFLGYFVENNTTSACVIDSEGNFTSNFVPENFSSGTTFYAQWGEASTFKITLERNFGSGGLDAIWVNEIGFFLDDKCSVRIGRLPEVPERLGYNFLGYFSSNNDDAVQLIDAFGEYTEAMVPSYFDADVTIYAHWESESLAYFDPTGGYWYVENGRMPQTRVTDEELIADLEASRVVGNVYEFAGERLGSLKVGGVEYCKFNRNWYRVEPIRWRLVYSAEQQDGFVFNAGNDPGSTTLAIMAEIVYVDAYSTTKIGDGEGYSASSIEALKYNQISESYLKSESREVEVFGSPSSTIQSEADTIFVASTDELQQFTSSQFNPNGGETVGKVGLSDLVRDYLALFGQAERYFVRDIGNQLNNITTYTPAGGLSQARATIRLGIQYSIKVRQYECKGV